MHSVIVVDDDKETLELLRTEIDWQKLNCRLDGMARTMEEGLFLVEEKRPELIITDVHMEHRREDLLQTLYEKRDSQRRPFVIIVSASRDFEEACRAIRYEAALYLTKPVQAEELENGIIWVLKRLRRERKGEKDLGEEENDISAATLRELQRIRTEMDRYSPFIQEAIRFIDSHLEQELSLTVICERLCLSHSYFSKKFKQETGRGYVSYVTMAKMEKARSLMEDPRNKANDIAKKLGYYDYSYFFQNFRRYFGCSPRQFKSHGKISK
jgi:two-component system response regulator YesN